MPTLRRKKRFLFGFVVGTLFGVVTLLVIGALIPSEVPPETASNFFFAASAVNATLLVAIAVTISAIIGGSPEDEKGMRMLFFVAQLLVVFVGMIMSGLGILLFNPATPVDMSKFVPMVDLIFSTWVIGFMLLIAGIWVTIVEGRDPGQAAK